jgi:hypothetical protein
MRASVQQSVVRGKLTDTVLPFALGVWVGTIGGSALATDPSPNVTPPSAGRIIRVTGRRHAIFASQTGNTANVPLITVVFGVVAGSSITVQNWFFDDTQALWIPFGPTSTRTPVSGSSNSISAATGTNFAVIGSKVFVQITANTFVQAMGYDVT